MKKLFNKVFIKEILLLHYKRHYKRMCKMKDIKEMIQYVHKNYLYFGVCLYSRNIFNVSINHKKWVKKYIGVDGLYWAPPPISLVRYDNPNDYRDAILKRILILKDESFLWWC